MRSGSALCPPGATETNRLPDSLLRDCGTFSPVRGLRVGSGGVGRSWVAGTGGGCPEGEGDESCRVANTLLSCVRRADRLRPGFRQVRVWQGCARLALPCCLGWPSRALPEPPRPRVSARASVRNRPLSARRPCAGSSRSQSQSPRGLANPGARPPLWRWTAARVAARISVRPRASVSAPAASPADHFPLERSLPLCRRARAGLCPGREDLKGGPR